MKRISVVLILILSIFLSMLPVGAQALGESAAEDIEAVLPEEVLTEVEEDAAEAPKAPEAEEPAPAEEVVEAEPAGETAEPEPAEEGEEPAAVEETPAEETVPAAEETPEAEEAVVIEVAAEAETVAAVAAAAAVTVKETPAPAPAEAVFALATDGAAILAEPKADGATEASSTDAEEVVPASSTDASTNLTKPKISSVKPTTTGVEITWGKVAGAAQYRVFRKTGSGSWKKVGDTVGTSLVDKKAKSGTTYTYTVRCLSANGKSYTSKYDTKGKSITYIAAPKLKSVSNATKGVTVKWGSVTGAAKYRVYRRTENGKWKKVGDTTATSIVDKKAKSGTTYYYTVRCISKNGKSTTSAYDETGLSILRLANPTISSVKSTAKGKVTVKWKKVTGAAGYIVYRRTVNGSWKKVATVKSGTTVKYVDKKAKSGTKYYYTVRAYYGSTKSYYNDGKTVKVK